MKMYDKAEKFVVDSFTKAGKERQIVHFKRTVYWVKQLKPDADEALLISAIAHDIERASRKPEMIELKRKSGLESKEFLRLHEERGAEIIGNFLRENSADKELIEKVKELVLRHEEGGTEEQNILKDADSLSFFENDIGHFLSKEKIRDVGGIDNAINKINWMFKRISSEKAKQIARKWHDEAMKKLEEVKKEQ